MAITAATIAALSTAKGTVAIVAQAGVVATAWAVSLCLGVGLNLRLDFSGGDSLGLSGCFDLGLSGSSDLRLSLDVNGLTKSHDRSKSDSFEHCSIIYDFQILNYSIALIC